jgi:hypothetical protein
MSITAITVIKQDKLTISPKDFKDGHAYMDNRGNIFIGNRHHGITGVSLCGALLAFADSTGGDDITYIEVNLTVTVTPL